MTNNNKNQKENLDLNSFFEEYILGLLKQTMETLIKEELTNVLQYSKYSYEGHGTGNSRNGYYYFDFRPDKYSLVSGESLGLDDILCKMVIGVSLYSQK